VPNPMQRRVLGFLLLWLGAFVVRAEPGPVPLTRAHAHNDYEHARPLAEALECGFGSVEADVHLVAGRLLVAHDLQAVVPARTLEALYLDPLRARVKANGGRVYRGGPTIFLLIDVKSAAEPTYAALHAVLKNYADMLTVFRDGVATPGAITVIVSGARAPTIMGAQAVRYAAMDGRIGDLAPGAPGRGLIPWVSDNWEKAFGSKWPAGAMPKATAEKLKTFVERAHAQGRLIRFWNTPDTPEAWRALRDAGVDLINTDQLTGLRDFLLSEVTRTQ
jgi:hypothetical protein